MKTDNKNRYLLPLALIFSLFFLWAISNNFLPTMVKKMMTLFEMNQDGGELIETAYWLAYFIFPIPIAIFMKRYSYKAGIILGLLVSAVGGLLFFPAASANSFPLYLCVFFIVAIGMCVLETAANPYVTELGDPATASRRLNLAQAFNGLGAFFAAMVLSKIVLGEDYTQATLPADYPGGWEGFVQTESHNFKLTYAIFGIILIVIAVIFIFSKLPKIQDEDSAGGKLLSLGVLKRRHLRNGVIAQFFYNGGQTAVNSLFLVYCLKYAGMTTSEATTFFGFYMLSFLLGRLIGTTLMGKFKPQNMLAFYALANVLLCLFVCVVGGRAAVYAMLGISFFMSIIYPTQFSLAVRDLKGDTKSGSAFLVMAIVGNAIIPWATARFQVSIDVPSLAYVVPLVCFAVCAWYGWKGYRL